MAKIVRRIFELLGQRVTKYTLEFPRFRGHLTAVRLVQRRGCLVVPKTPPYPEEFRREAVRLLCRGDRTIPELARDLGCSPQSLRNWSKQLDLDAGRRSDGLTSD